MNNIYFHTSKCRCVNRVQKNCLQRGHKAHEMPEFRKKSTPSGLRFAGRPAIAGLFTRLKM